jgi:hypothetical protein
MKRLVQILDVPGFPVVGGEIFGEICKFYKNIFGYYDFMVILPIAEVSKKCYYLRYKRLGEVEEEINKKNKDKLGPDYAVYYVFGDRLVMIKPLY